MYGFFWPIPAETGFSAGIIGGVAESSSVALVRYVRMQQSGLIAHNLSTELGSPGTEGIDPTGEGLDMGLPSHTCQRRGCSGRPCSRHCHREGYDGCSSCPSPKKRSAASFSACCPPSRRPRRPAETILASSPTSSPTFCRRYVTVVTLRDAYRPFMHAKSLVTLQYH